MKVTKKRLMRFGLVAVGTIAVLVAVAAIGLSRAGGVDGVMRQTARAMIVAQQSDQFDDGRIHVITLGTGTPAPGSSRLPAANIIFAGREVILVDAGEGASRTMSSMLLPVHRISTVLITHLHSDHIGGLGPVLNESWNSYRAHDIDVYGSKGVTDILDGLALQYKADIHYRSADHVEHNDPKYALGVAHVLDVTPEDGLVRVFERNGVIVDAFHVDHGHIEPAFGYRIEYNGRSAVFSGDTVATPLLVDAAENADVLFHEAMNMRMMDNAAKAFDELDMPVHARRARAVTKYHAGTLEVAKVAAQANVKKLVLTHLDPGPPNRIAKALFVQGMDEHYGGPIVIAEDRMQFSW